MSSAGLDKIMTMHVLHVHLGMVTTGQASATYEAVSQYINSKVRPHVLFSL